MPTKFGKPWVDALFNNELDLGFLEALRLALQLETFVEEFIIGMPNGTQATRVVKEIVHNKGQFATGFELFLLKASGEWATVQSVYTPTPGVYLGFDYSKGPYAPNSNSLNSAWIVIYRIDDPDFNVDDPITLKARLTFAPRGLY